MKRFPVDVSYLASRDPSIVCRDGRPLPRKQNLIFGNEISEEESTSSVKVFLRIKPQHAIEVGPEVPSFKIIGSDSLTTTSWLRGKQVVQQFRFSTVLPERASQRLVFDSVARRPLQAVLTSQRSGLLFTYGTTNAGKTHTMFGNDADPGLIPLSLSAIFSSLGDSLLHGPVLKPSETGVAELGLESRAQETTLRLKLLEWNPKLGEDTYSMSMMSGTQVLADNATLPRIALHANLLPGQLANVWVSCVEIYQEQAYDLLSSSQSALSLRGDNLRGLTLVCVESAEEAQRLMLLARHRLHSAETGLNLRSSRSHCVFTVRIAMTTPDRPHSQVQFDFVDLAGTERASKTNNQGLRLMESSKINQSLSVLGRCLKAMRSNQKGGTEVVPFRDSLLTRLLKTPLLSLSGENVSLLVCASAESKTFAETCKALQFASIARRVQLNLPPRAGHSQAAPSRFSILAVARPSSSGWLVPPPRGQKVNEKGCTGCQRAEENAVARLAEQETRLRRELVDRFTEMMRDVDERHRRDLKNQENRLMNLIKHREDHMLATMAANECQLAKHGSKRFRSESADESDVDNEVEELDLALVDEIKQLREEASAAAKSLAEAEFRAAHSELRLREMSSQDPGNNSAEKSAESEVQQLNALLDEARVDHLRDRGEIERLREELRRTNEDAALKEIELDEAITSSEELQSKGLALETLTAQLQAERMTFKTLEAELQSKVSTLESLVSVLETSKAQMQAEISTLKTSETELQSKISVYDASEDELVLKMAALVTREAGATSQLSTLESEVSQLRKAASQRDAELLALREQIVGEDNKETNLELEVKRLLQHQVCLTEEHNASCAAVRLTNAALTCAEQNISSLTAENEVLAHSLEQQQLESKESAARSAAQFAQFEVLLRQEREVSALAKRDAAAATAQLYRRTPARCTCSQPSINIDDAKENSAVGANLGPPERPIDRITRSSRRLGSSVKQEIASAGDKKASRKLFVQQESFVSPESSPEVMPRTRSRRK